VPVALALAASLLWGVADYLGGSAARRHAVLAVVTVTQLSGIASIAIVMAVRAEAPPPLWSLWPALAAGLMGVFVLITFYRAMAVGVMSIIAPILATSTIVPVAVGVALGERPSPAQWAGIVAALVGVMVLARAPGDPRTSAHDARLGIILGLLATTVLGVQLVALDAAADVDALWAVFVSRAVTTVCVCAAALVARPAMPGRAVPLIATVGVIDTAANVCFAIAVSTGLLSIVAVLSALYPAVTTALAFVLLGERISRTQKAGVGVAFVGVLLVSGG
jgi:drug/metabolite transporter (DMT)-like permease